ncbi:MAG: TadE family protein, partial [Pseudomonadota bacterium]
MGEISLFRSASSVGGGSPRIFIANRSGASAVEFAIVAPVLLAMLLGMLAYGIYLSADHSVRQLAADVARETIAGIDDEERI